MLLPQQDRGWRVERATQVQADARAESANCATDSTIAEQVIQNPHEFTYFLSPKTALRCLYSF